MRSNLVFTASDRVKNPFLLCHLVRVTSRSFHKKGLPIQVTINKVLALMSEYDIGAMDAEAKAAWAASFSRDRDAIKRPEFDATDSLYHDTEKAS